MNNPFLAMQVLHSLDKLSKIVSSESFSETTGFIFDLYEWKQVTLLNELKNNEINVYEFFRGLKNQFSLVSVKLNEFNNVGVVELLEQTDLVV